MRVPGFLAAGLLLCVSWGQASVFTVTNTSNSGPGSLQQAIQDCVLYAGWDTIEFNIPGPNRTISLSVALPAIPYQTIIDGTTQPGYSPGRPVVEIYCGAIVIGSYEGLHLPEGDCIIRGLIVTGAATEAIHISSSNNVVTGCWIGVDPNGIQTRAGGGIGVLIQGSGNRIGDALIQNRNVICGGIRGISIPDASSSLNTIQNNWIGPLPLAPDTAVGAVYFGIYDASGGSNVIGDNTAGRGNVISGCGWEGMMIRSGNNRIQGNIVGLNPNGNLQRGNGRSGISIIDGASNTVGGSTPEARNVVSGNASAGISLTGASATDNRIIGNYIGTDVTGESAIANNSGGVAVVQNASANVIGTANAGERNVISGNSIVGITLGNASPSNTIQGNYIGVSASGLALPNSLHGVAFTTGSMGMCLNNLLGGTAPGEGNLIANHPGIGVAVFEGNDGNRILGNVIRNNTMPGIDRLPSGVTSNDTNDVDGNQNYPVITSARSDGSQVQVDGTLNSTPNTASIRIEFFANTAADPTGAGEGEQYLGATTVSTDGSGNASFSAMLALAGVPATSYVSATATGPTLGTSEFSPASLLPVTLSRFSVE